MIDVDLALAFTTGMVATVNPCGFAMLPAYVSFFLGVERERASVGRAFVVATAVTTGFAGTFAVVGLIVSRVTTSVYKVAPWFSLVIGGALALLGIAFLAGLEPTLRLPRLDRGGRTGGLGSMALFGVSYAVASIGCELPLFLAVVSLAFGTSFASGVVYFVVFGVGFGAVIVLLSIALAMTQQSIVHTMRRVLPFVNRIAGGLLVIAGAYVAWYGWIEIRNKTAGDATVGRVTDWSATASTWLDQNLQLVVLLFVLAVIGTVSYSAWSRRANVR